MEKLASMFAQRETWHNNRASTLFMCYVNKVNDNVLVFQNYWHWKSRIDTVACVVRLYHKDGSIFDIKEVSIKSHNEISIKQLFNVEDFVGTIDCEIISLSNIGFPFPAILCFYRNTNAISVLHSAGRILNSNEATTQTHVNESNFLCILDDTFEPYIHVFSGSYVDENHKIELLVKSKDNVVLFEKTIDHDFNQAFQSEIFKLRSICTDQEIAILSGKSFYLIFKSNLIGAFGRFMVGNYNRKIDAFFVTHSFSHISPDNSDFTDKPDDLDASCFLPIPCAGPLSVEAVSYPTNAKSKLTIYERSSALGACLEKTGQQLKVCTGGEHGSIFKIKLQGDAFSCWHFVDPSPSRLNVSYNYSLPNSDHPTDIAKGFMSHFYTPKVSHWGAGFHSNNFETYIFVSNQSHNFLATLSSEATLTIFNNDVEYEKNFVVPAESAICIKVSELDVDLSDAEFFSWRMKTEQTTLITFWISFDVNTGQICGEHGF